VIAEGKHVEVYAELRFNFERHLFTFIEGSDGAYNALEALGAVFEARQTLGRSSCGDSSTASTVRQQLLDDEFVAKFVARAQGLRHAAVAVGHDIAGMEVGDVVLAGLPDDFETILTIIHGSDHEMPLKNLLAKLLAVEQRCFTKPVAIDHE
jgi:hypothetical protein